MTKREFKQALTGTSYINDNGKINYHEVLMMITLANELHARFNENKYPAIAKACREENDLITDNMNRANFYNTKLILN